MSHLQHDPHNPTRGPAQNRTDALQRTLEARRHLYDVIVLFRKNAREVDDLGTRAIFTLAAEIITGLVSGFRQYEEQIASASENSPP